LYFFKKMRALFFCAAVAAAVQVEPVCDRGLMGNFAANVQALFIEPITDKFTFVMYTDVPPPYTTPAGSTLPIFNRDQPFVDRCTALGVQTVLDVLVVNVKAVTGHDLLPSFFYSQKLMETVWVLDICNKTSSLSGLPESYVAPEVCKAATDLVRCSTFNSVWVLPWLAFFVGLAIVIVVATSCLALALR
jgi:hypothetical protein